MSRVHIQSDGTLANTYVTVDDKLVDDVFRIEVLAEGRSEHPDYTRGLVLVRLTLVSDDVQIDTDQYTTVEAHKRARPLSNNSQDS